MGVDPERELLQKTPAIRVPFLFLFKERCLMNVPAHVLDGFARPSFRNAQNQEEETLLARVRSAAAREREATQAVLEHLLEVERRRLYLKLGYPSLFDFCVRDLGYCAGSAHLRIQAMRLLKEVPAREREGITQKISSGALTLSQLSNVQTYSRQVLSHRVAPAQKLEIIGKLEGQSTRESQKIILKELGLEGSQYERLRVKGPDQVELTVTLDAATVELLEEWKALTSHSNPEGRNAEALRAALKLAVERARKEKGLGVAKAQPADPNRPSVRRTSLHAHEVQSAESPAPSREVERPVSCPVTPLAGARSIPEAGPQAIPHAIRRLVWARDGGRCTYRDPRTERRCEGTRYLEIDHIRPRARGGGHELANLRLLCGGHHRLRHLEEEGGEEAG
jgi:5-methylcytosine-specific restriction endonuclease McrA